MKTMPCAMAMTATRLTRLIAQDVLCFPRLDVWLGRVTTVSGSNAAGKSNFLRLVACLIGESRESFDALWPTDSDNRRREGVDPQATLYLDGPPPLEHAFRGLKDERTGVEAKDGPCWALGYEGCNGSAAAHEPPRYRMRFKPSGFIVERQEGDAWRKLPGTPDAARASLFDRGSAPSRLLDAATDSDRIELLLGVAEIPGYDRKAVMAECGLADFKLAPMPAGMHPLSDLMDDRDSVFSQVFSKRTAVGQALSAARGTAQEMEAALPPTAPAVVASDLEATETALAAARSKIALAESEAEHRYAMANEAAKAACREAIQALERCDEAWEAEQRAALEQRIKARAAEREIDIDGLERERDDAISHAFGALELVRAEQRGEQPRIEALAAEVRVLRERAERAAKDSALREAAANARAKADRLAEEHGALTRALDALRTKAASFVAASLPGVRVTFDEKGKRNLEVQTDGGWKGWKVANEGRKTEIATAWSRLHQEKHATGVEQAIILCLDRGEGLDAAARQRIVAGGGQLILALRDEGPLVVRVEAP